MKKALAGLVIAFIVLIVFGTLVWTLSTRKSVNSAQINPDAFVYVLAMGITEGNTLQLEGLRNGFVVGNGEYILTAAHCLEGFQNSHATLVQPIIISPYYGDFFEARIIALDQENDIAILKPEWKIHPALQLETGHEWKQDKTINITGYPPQKPNRGGNGNFSSQIMSEEVRLQSSSGKNSYATCVGPVRYPGKGWSGSPFLNPQTGKVVGILSREKYRKKHYFIRQHFIYSGSHESILQLLNDTRISEESTQKSYPELDRRKQFDRILSIFDSFQSSDPEQSQTLIQELCADLPDSPFAHTLAGWVFDLSEREAYHQKAVTIAQNSSRTRAYYGNYLVHNNKFEKAAEQFRMITELNPDHLFANHGLLKALASTDIPAAEKLGLELTTKWPENGALHFEYSKILRAQKRYPEELLVIQKAVELSDPLPFQYQRYLADSLTNNTHYTEAEKAYGTLLQSHECEECWMSYASLLLRMGPEKSEAAKEAQKKAAAFEPKTLK